MQAIPTTRSGDTNKAYVVMGALDKMHIDQAKAAIYN
jgi:hypothetical protein